MAKTADKPKGDALTEMKALQNRYERLKDLKTRCETHLENSKLQLEKLKEKARADYGTDDLAELRAKLEEMKADNARMQQEYKASLDAIEAGLQEVDESFRTET